MTLETAMAFAIRPAAAAAKGGETTIEIDVYDVVGDSWWSDEAVSAKSVRRKLKSLQANKILVRINSGGGDAYDGIAIFNLLRENPARVEVDVDGLAASAASIIAMAGDEIRVAENASLMIHKAWTIVRGGEDEMSSAKEHLSRLNDGLATTYALVAGERGKKTSKQDFLELMDAETWLTADEAIELGLADKKSGARPKMVASLSSLSRPVLSSSKVPGRVAAEALELSASANLRSELSDADIERLTLAAGIPAAPETQKQPTPKQLELPAVNQQPPDEGAHNPSREETTMSFLKVLALLSLPADATEDQAVAAIQNIRNSAAIGTEVEKIVGSAGQGAVGAVRALKEAQVASQTLASEVAGIRITMARKDFESARAEGLKSRKLTPAVAKLYADKFEAEVKPGDDGSPARGDGSAVVADLVGFLAVATAVVAAPVVSPSGEIAGIVASTHDGKRFEELKPVAQARLKRDNVELYNTLRQDAIARGAL